MRTAGVSRLLDSVGRVVIPKDLRELYNWGTADTIELFPTEDGILLKKESNGCGICASVIDLKVVCGRKVCRTCLKKIVES